MWPLPAPIPTMTPEFPSPPCSLTQLCTNEAAGSLGIFSSSIPWKGFTWDNHKRAVWLLIGFILHGEQQPGKGRVISFRFDISFSGEVNPALNPLGLSPSSARQNPPSPTCSGNRDPYKPVSDKESHAREPKCNPKNQIILTSTLFCVHHFPPPHKLSVLLIPPSDALFR